MNQRIRELAEQSYKEVIETNDYNGSAYTVREFDKDKFAELIVRDVLDEVLQAMDDGMDVYDTVADKFGVEE